MKRIMWCSVVIAILLQLADRLPVAQSDMALAAFTIENCWDASCICDFIEGNYDNDKCTRKDGKELEKAVR